MEQRATEGNCSLCNCLCGLKLPAFCKSFFFNPLCHLGLKKAVVPLETLY